MLVCFLLLHQAAEKWFLLAAIPALIAGGVAAMCLILSGIKGIIEESFSPKCRVEPAARPERVVQWMAHGRH